MKSVRRGVRRMFVRLCAVILVGAMVLGFAPTFAIYRDGVMVETVTTFETGTGRALYLFVASEIRGQIPEYSVRLVRADRFQIDGELHSVEITDDFGFANRMSGSKAFILRPIYVHFIKQYTHFLRTLRSISYAGCSSGIALFETLNSGKKPSIS